MNPNTRVAVHCYAGDGRQVSEMLAHHQTHECPITILSPEDSKVEMPDVDCRFGGKQESIGPLSVARQREHMKILLSYPENHFLMNDADSLCLSPQIPPYLYAEPDVVWSNVVWIESPDERTACDHRNLPYLAFQPPYFLSRWTIEKLLSVQVPYRGAFDGFIDHFMMQTAVGGGIVWKGFHGGISSALSLNNPEFERSFVKVRHTGAVFVHGVKTPRFWRPLVEAHKAWVADHRAAVDHRSADQRNTTQGIKPLPHEYVHPTSANNRITYHRANDPRPPQRRLIAQRRGQRA